MITMEELIKVLTVSLGSIVEGMEALIIGSGIIRTLVLYCRSMVTIDDTPSIRLDLGKTLAMALEFLLAADILRTAVAPSWDEIGKLASIAALRIVLNYVLAQELHRENKVISH